VITEFYVNFAGAAKGTYPGMNTGKCTDTEAGSRVANPAESSTGFIHLCGVMVILLANLFHHDGG